jgi:hypothetical protein
VSASIELQGAVLDEVAPRTARNLGAKVKTLLVKRMKRSGKSDEKKWRKKDKFRASLLRHFFEGSGI